MSDIERRLRAAMHAAVDGEPPPADLVPAVQRRHRRYLIRMAGVAVAGAIAVAAVPVALASRGGLGTGRGPSATGPAGSPVLSTPAPSSSSPAPHRSHTSVPARRHHGPAWMSGVPMPPSESLRLLVTGRDPVWFSSPSDSSHAIAGLPRSHYPYSVTRVNGGWAMAFQPACKCQAPRVPVYYLADGSASARRVGVAQSVFPGSGRGTIWLQSHNKGKKGTTAREVGPSGRTIGSPVPLPVGYTIQQGIGPDLLLSPSSQGPGTVYFELWNPRTRQLIRRFPDVIASSGGQVAWGICGGCPVRVLDLRTGVISTISVPGKNWAYDGQFSADGRYLAVHMSGGVRPDGYSTLERIAVIDLRTGRLGILTGGSIGTDLPEALIFGWQAGDTLVAAVTGRSVTQVATWHPGAAHLRVRKFWLPHGMTVVLGPYG